MGAALELACGNTPCGDYFFVPQSDTFRQELRELTMKRTAARAIADLVKDDDPTKPELVARAKEFDAPCFELEMKISEIEFRQRNRGSPVHDINLIGCFIPFAMDKFHESVKECIKAGWKTLRVTVGSINSHQVHSDKLKPAIEQACILYGVTCQVDPLNKELLLVDTGALLPGVCTTIKNKASCV